MSREPGQRTHALRSLLLATSCEARVVLRDTAGLLVPIGMPLLILVTSAPGSSEKAVSGNRTALEIGVLPLVFVMVIAFIGLINMPSFLAHYRRSGILLRLGSTPASPLVVLAAQALVSLAQAAVGVVIASVVAVVVFGAGLPASPIATIGTLALVAAAMYGIGMIIASLAPTPNSALAIGLVVFLAISALGGLFGGRHLLPPLLADASRWLPMGAGVDALGAAWAGLSLPLGALLALAATVVVSTIVSVCFFRWE